ncbi:hypothetical protein ACSW8Q_16350 (plasmid) [Clostridium perfringens]|uniref:hypothetical protein n=1 Tax=Clostridium perfringens TaxID=1502 RepID=UPI0024BC93B1|nr:hypothetical protein [Clostridium perfringens]ELC8464137.1 hypothetical protein [Clostridium perfringens]
MTILILFCAVTLILGSKILYEYIQLKQEIKLNSQKVELKDKNINKSIKEMLTNLFEIGDAKLEQQEFFDEYFQEILHYFSEDSNENRDYEFKLIFDHFFYNIEENEDKENLKTNIKIENIYKVSDNNYEVKFIVEKEFNYKDNPNIIKLEEEYNALIINENNKYLIKEIYNIKDFNNYINREHEISKYYTKRSELYSKYLIFKKGQYSSLNEGLDREEILNEGYII